MELIVIEKAREPQSWEKKLQLLDPAGESVELWEMLSASQVAPARENEDFIDEYLRTGTD